MNMCVCGGLGWGNLLVMKSWYVFDIHQTSYQSHTSKRIRIRERVVARARLLFARARLVVSATVTRVLGLI